MRFFLLLFLIAISFDASAAPTNTPQASIGVSIAAPAGQAVVELSRLSQATGSVFTIYCGPFTANTSGNVMPCRLNGQVYKVGGNTGGGSGKQAVCFGINSGSGTAGSLWQWMSSTTTFADNVAAPSGTKFQGGVSANYQYVTGGTTNVQAPNPGTYTFDGSSFPGIQIGGSLNFYISANCFEF